MMMKNITKILMIIGIAALLAVLSVLTSCEPIGYYIEQEEALSPSTIRGNVFSMVPMGGKLYVQNGRVYTNSFDGSGSWTEISRPSDTRFVALASDDTYLYGKDSSNNVWAKTETSDWIQVHTASGELFLFDNGVFDNSDGTTTGRVAYIRDNGGVKKLTGTGTTAAPTGTGAGSGTKNCVHIITDDKDYFTDESIVATDGTNIFSVTSEDRDDSTNSRTIKYQTPGSGSWTDVSTTDESVTCMAMSSDGTLLVGTLENYEIWTITGSKPDSRTTASETASTIGSHSILGIWEYKGIRYASIYNLKVSTYNSLWYRKSNGKWDKI